MRILLVEDDEKLKEALCFQLEGYSAKELSAHYQVPSNHIRAWQSKARRFLQQDAALCALLS